MPLEDVSGGVWSSGTSAPEPSRRRSSSGWGSVLPGGARSVRSSAAERRLGTAMRCGFARSRTPRGCAARPERRAVVGAAGGSLLFRTALSASASRHVVWMRHAPPCPRSNSERTPVAWSAGSCGEPIDEFLRLGGNDCVDGRHNLRRHAQGLSAGPRTRNWVCRFRAADACHNRLRPATTATATTDVPPDHRSVTQIDACTYRCSTAWLARSPAPQAGHHQRGGLQAGRARGTKP